VAPPSMAISIEKEGRFYFNGKRMSIGEIEKSVRSAIRAAENKQNLTATIFSEQDAPVKYVVQVMDLANRLKLQAILATEPPK